MLPKAAMDMRAAQQEVFLTRELDIRIVRVFGQKGLHSRIGYC